MRPYRFQLIFICIFAVISTIFSIVGPKILGNATTLLAEGLAGKYTSQGSIDFAGIFRILRNLTIIYLLSALFNYLSGWMMAGVTQKITYSLREEISKKINRLPLNF
ncbi:MAG TPA: multidrug ABC transporter ATP-binding protein, partial [Erysipelotrichaceae bacterium]|nr:multidrug ABC transporter ATP-binding protein [Erysipelotrichaceae bacterium]